MHFVIDAGRLSIVRLLTSIFLQNEALREEARKGELCQPDPLVGWLKAAKKDKRLKMKDPEMAAQVFNGMINFPALYSPLQTAKELKPIRDEIISVFLSRYGA